MSPKTNLIKNVFFLYLCRVIVSDSSIDSEYTTSIAKLVKLLYTEIYLLENLDDFTLEQPENLAIKLFSEQIHSEHEKALIDPEAYFGIPQNAFKMIRRMCDDWQIWKSLMNEHIVKVYVRYMEYVAHDMPKEIDMLYALAAIDRLIYTYKLNIDDFINGNLNGIQYDTKLNVLDLFAIAEQSLHFRGGKEQRIKWYEAVLNHWNTTQAVLYEQFDLNVDYIEFRIIELNYLTDVEQPALMDWQHIFPTVNTTSSEYQHHDKGCRGEYNKSPNHKLLCYYKYEPTAFLKLAPIKMEILNIDPYIAQFHDVIYEREMKQLRVSAVANLNLLSTDHFNIDGRRTQRSTAIKDSNIPALFNRLTDVTDMNVLHSELMEVGNYGIGGEHYTHADYLDYTSYQRYVAANSEGERIATLMFYLSTVDLGGATIFPFANVTIYPKKGSALFWYNLYKTGELDARTLHAACPVLVGSKWIATKWIAEKTQIFLKPCPINS